MIHYVARAADSRPYGRSCRFETAPFSAFSKLCAFSPASSGGKAVERNAQREDLTGDEGTERHSIR